MHRDGDRVNLGMHLEAVIVELGGVLGDGAGCTWRWQSSELRDALGGHDRANLEVNLEAAIVRT